MLPLRVLFVDDNAMNRKVVKSMLEAAEVPMVEAESAELGLQLIDIHHFDLILMDLRMPGMDGLAAIRAVRARTDAKAGLPIIVVTADNGPDVRGQALAAGADDLLHKPVQMQALFDAIGSAMTRSGERGALLA
jgi:two-component system, OmpR family, response regulator QseB